MHIEKITQATGDKPEFIVFFNGWGMDSRVISPIKADKNHVIIHCHDYQDIDKPLFLQSLEQLTNGHSTHVVAWSMGVWAANYLLSGSNVGLKQLLAINGTPYGIDEKLGIPPAQFAATLAQWSASNREKFYSRLFAEKNINSRQNVLPQRGLDDQAAELHALLQMCQTPPSQQLTWDTAYISRRDVIFPANNQRAFWHSQAQTHVVETALPHCPFAQVTNWKNLLEYGFSNTER